jgi:hypothetical protein
VLAEECGRSLSAFFQGLRGRPAAGPAGDL